MLKYKKIVRRVIMLMNEKSNLNPFNRDYHIKEIKKFNLNDKKIDNIQLKSTTIHGRVDGYMYKNFLESIDNVPILSIDNQIWMSITPMEIESHYMPKKLAGGRVGVGGLGLGYFTQSILDDDAVEEVIVYETDKNIINLYLENFGNHKKLTIKNEDVRNINGEYFDFFYNDIYPTQMDFQAIEDMAILNNNNDISFYHFWTLEHMILEMLEAGYKDSIPYQWQFTYFPFLQNFLETKGSLANITGIGDALFEKFEKHEII